MISLIYLVLQNLFFSESKEPKSKMTLIKNKRGWLMIMEAFIAIMFFLGFSIYMIQRQTPKVDIGEEIAKQARYVIKAAAHDNEVRNAVIGRNNCSVKNFVYQQLRQYAPYLDYHVKLCDPGMSCRITYGEKQDYKAKGTDLEKKEIYADDYLFSANLTVFRPTVMKIFLWQEEKGPSMPGTEEFFYPSCVPPAAVEYDCNVPPDNVKDVMKDVNPLSICENGTRITCDDGSSFVSEQPTTPKLEDDNSCKNNIDNNCNNLVGCFGGAGTTRTANWEPQCDGIIATYAGCPHAIGCICLSVEKAGPPGSPSEFACIDGFDNNGNGVLDDADPQCQ